jgi:hypothetical protein
MEERRLENMSVFSKKHPETLGTILRHAERVAAGSVRIEPDAEGEGAMGGASVLRPLGGAPARSAVTRRRRVEGPEVMDRFMSELHHVDDTAARFARCVGGCPPEYLQEYARHGLLDAARSFDEGEGVPFARWAAFWMRHAMIDGLLEWDDVPPGVRRQLRALASADLHPTSDKGTSPSEALGGRLSLMALGVTLVSLGETSASVARTPKKEETRAPALSFEGLCPSSSPRALTPFHRVRALPASGPASPSNIEPKAKPPVSENVASLVERFHKGELDRDGYVGAMIEEAMGYLGPLCRAEVELVQRTLRFLIDMDPALEELVDRATSSPAA